jgi:hypothetical protein
MYVARIDLIYIHIPRLATGLVQFLVGVLLVTNSFILTIQSSEVIQLILNLTALFFIQEIDDMAFKLAHLGLFSKGIREDCEKVSNLKRMFPKETVDRRFYLMRALAIILIVILIVPFGIVFAWQMRGRFLCKHGMCLSC